MNSPASMDLQACEIEQKSGYDLVLLFVTKVFSNNDPIVDVFYGILRRLSVWIIVFFGDCL